MIYAEHLNEIKNASDPLEQGRRIKSLLADYPTVTYTHLARALGMTYECIVHRLNTLDSFERLQQQQGEVHARIEQAKCDGSLCHHNSLTGHVHSVDCSLKLYNIVPCARCKVPIDAELAEGTNLCLGCAKAQAQAQAMTLEPKKTHPRERGLKLCLEPKCPKWIKPLRKDGVTQRNFCITHDVARIDKFPLHDRDGFPIWVTKDLIVLRICDMGESHLMNSIGFLEAAAKRREAITGRPWTESVMDWPRYAFLITEVNQRDACKVCRGGYVDDVESIGQIAYCACKLGQSRKAAESFVAPCKADGITVTFGVLFTFLSAILIGAKGIPFLRDVIAHLHAMGAF